MEQIKTRIQRLYPEQQEEVFAKVQALIQKWQGKCPKTFPWVDKQDVMMITYGDGIYEDGKAPLATLKTFADTHLKGNISAIHLLPMFPYTSDDGFSVTDFRKIHENLGDWGDIERLSEGYDLMFDAVINHVSKSSGYFQEYLKGNPDYRGFFHECDPAADYRMVTRPRALPLLTEFETADGKRHLWTTFSDDQIDLNYQSPEVTLEILDVMLFYASKGARFLRFDAIGFAWKELGTNCMHLWQTHELVKLMREVIACCATGCTIITETNVPHKDNISYFGNGHDEAGLVYQFPLPPLTLHSFLSQNARRLTDWASSLEPTTPDTTYFNFLASHDGIGMRPVEDLLSESERQKMVETVLARGGQIGYRVLPDGSEAPYELNINYLDAIAGDCTDQAEMVQRFLAAQCVLLSVMGMPGIYYHSLLGSRNCYKDYEASGIKRRINREKLEWNALSAVLSDEISLRAQVLSGFQKLLGIRKTQPAFAPNAPQEILRLDDRLFSLVRGSGAERVLVVINVSGQPVSVETNYCGVELLGKVQVEHIIHLAPYDYQWIRL